jgi:hypothetical protein
MSKRWKISCSAEVIVEGPDTPQDALEAARGRVIVIEGELRSIVVVQLDEPFGGGLAEVVTRLTEGAGEAIDAGLAEIDKRYREADPNIGKFIYETKFFGVDDAQP